MTTPAQAARIPRPFAVCDRGVFSSGGGRGIAPSLGNFPRRRFHLRVFCRAHIGLHLCGQRSEVRWSVMICISSFRARSRTLDRLGDISIACAGGSSCGAGASSPFVFSIASAMDAASSCADSGMARGGSCTPDGTEWLSSLRPSSFFRVLFGKPLRSSGRRARKMPPCPPSPSTPARPNIPSPCGRADRCAPRAAG